MRARTSIAAACLLLLAGCGSSTVDGTGPNSDRGTSTDAATESAPAANGQPSASVSGAGGSPGADPSAGEGGGSGGGAGRAGATTYTDARYGFTATVPAGFTEAGAMQDRGMQFNGPSGVALKVYGSENLLQSDAEQLCHEQAEAYRSDGGSATIQVTGDRCSVTATLEGTSHQLETWVGPASLNHVEVSWPAAAADPGRAAAKQSVSGFTPGDLATAH